MSNNYSEERELYRDPARGRISGVCAGISDYFGLEVWVVRIIAVSALLFFQWPILLAYGIAYFVMDPKPGSEKHNQSKYKKHRARAKAERAEKESEADHEKASVQQVWKKGGIPGQMMRKTKKRFSDIEKRLQNMESYVTSNQFQLRKEFRDL